MTAKDLKLYKTRLLELRARLRGDTNQMGRPIFDGPRTQAAGDLPLAPTHMADIGTDNIEREFTLRLMEANDQTQDRIEAALQRIEDGSYGSCAECGKRIPKARLNAIPYAIECVACAVGSEAE